VKSPMIPLKGNLVDRTRQVWQPRLGRDLSCEEARRTAENAAGFFAILVEWSRLEGHHHRDTGACQQPERDSKRVG
jgi:hypothetical protein